MKVVTCEQMRALDRRAIEERGIPGLELMERAGRAVAEAALRLTAGDSERPVVIVCGGGNNGGDGLVAARLLAEKGRPVKVLLVTGGRELRGDAAENLKRLQEAGSVPVQRADAEVVRRECEGAALVVDALLGTGVSGELRSPAPEVIEAVNAAARPVLAVDIPSGLHADTGRPLGGAVMARETVTMGLPKLGLLMSPGADYAGWVTVADIGLPSDLVKEAEAAGELIEPAWVRLLLPPRRRTAHKGDFGQVLVIAGSVGMTGAACLCAEGALRVGAGLVRVGCPDSLNDILEMKLTEAMTFPLPETYERTLDTRALALILELSEQASVVAIGPGLSRHPDTELLVQRLVGRMEKPMVLDADALNALAEAPTLLESDHAPMVLTPHPRELERLLDLPAREVQSNRAHYAELAANRFRSVIILKGAYTLVAEPGRPLAINPTGNPGMATGGTGDVLTGAVAGLIGQGLLPFEAACAGAYLHGLAGDLAAARLGEASVVAGDVAAMLPEALRQVSGQENG